MNNGDISQVALERRVLADFVIYHKLAREHSDTYLINRDTFTVESHCAAWQLLYEATTDDQVALLGIAKSALALDTTDKQNEFLAEQSTIESYVDAAFNSLALANYKRKVLGDITNMLGRYNFGNADTVETAILEVLNSVPKPPPLGLAGMRELPEDVGCESVPKQLMSVPGFIDAMVRYSVDSARVFSHTLSFAGALVFLSHLMGRKFTDEDGETTPNLYVMALARSGGGKNHPRRVNQRLTNDTPLRGTVENRAESGAALEESLYYQPTLLFQYDEVQELFSSFKNQAANSNAQSIRAFLNSIYSDNNTIYSMRRLARDGGKRREIFYPALSFFGTGITKAFYETLTDKELINGLIGRCLVFEATDIATKMQVGTSGTVPKVPDLVKHFVDEMAARHQAQGVNQKPDRTVIPYGEGAHAKLVECGNACQRNAKKYNDEDEPILSALWGRASEKIAKLAMIYAVSENFSNPVITVAGVEWANELTVCIIRRMAYLAKTLNPGNDIERYCNKILKYLKKQPGRSCSQRDAVRHASIAGERMIRDVLSTLEMRGQISCIKIRANGVILQLTDK